jgi:hypothetical protein
MIGNRVCAAPNSLDDITITLTDQESAEMRCECQLRSRVLKGPLDDEEVLIEAELAGCALPERLLRVLSRFRVRGNAFGALFFSTIFRSTARCLRPQTLVALPPGTWLR